MKNIEKITENVIRRLAKSHIVLRVAASVWEDKYGMDAVKIYKGLVKQTEAAYKSLEAARKEVASAFMEAHPDDKTIFKYGSAASNAATKALEVMKKYNEAAKRALKQAERKS